MHSFYMQLFDFLLLLHLSFVFIYENGILDLCDSILKCVKFILKFKVVWHYMHLNLRAVVYKSLFLFLTC